MTFDELNKWDARFLELADVVATWSKGPRKRVGACLVRPNRSIASLGYNGPPRGFDDELFLTLPRDEQHKIVVHAEYNALEQLSDSDKLLGSAANLTLYVTPLYPCKHCAEKIVKAGIVRVVAYCGHISDDWAESAKIAENIFKHAGVDYVPVV